MARYVFFDFFGTLADYDPSVHPEVNAPWAFAQRVGVEVAEDQSDAHWQRAWADLDAQATRTGREFSMTQLALRYWRAIGSPPLDSGGIERLIAEYLAAWTAAIVPAAHSVECVTDLAIDHTLAVVSNTHDPTMVARLAEQFGLQPAFDDIVTSVDVGWRKPHHRIFDAALRRVGADAADAVFVGDNWSADIEGPRAVGMTAVRRPCERRPAQRVPRGPARTYPVVSLQPVSRSPAYLGNYLPAFLTLLMCIGYYSVGTVLGAKSLADLLSVPYAPTVVVVAAVSILIGIFGYKILQTMGKLITNVSIVVLSVVTVVLIFHGGGPGTAATATGTDYWLARSVLFTAVFGYTASWAPYASDYSRYLPENSKPRSIFTAATAGLFASTTWMMCLGAGLITLMPDGDVLDTFGLALPDWLRYVVLLTLGLSAIPHNSVNLYSGAMNSLTCDVKLPQWVTVTVAGLVGLVIALVFGGDQFQANFLLFLHVLSYYITPWVAVLLVDYYVVQRSGRNTPAFENFYTPTGVFGRFNGAGLAALIVGVVVSVPFMANDFFTGPIGASLAGADLSYFVSGIVAAVVYLVMRPRTGLSGTLPGDVAAAKPPRTE